MSDELALSFKKGVNILAGEGRGKTSAAMGRVLTAASHGLSVCVIFFLKSTHELAEYKILSSLPRVHWVSFGRAGFMRISDTKEKDRELAGQALDYALDTIKSGKWDLIVLDEVINAAYYGLIRVEDIERLLLKRPDRTALLLTGKFVDRRLAQMVDAVYHFINVKHPYERGILARKGFDY